VGQQPNIELEVSHLPRPEPTPAAARRWSPTRPGDPAGPRDVPWGGAYGTTGPDTGFALRMLAERDVALPDGEHRENTDALVAAVAAARASHLGRAPTGGDLDVALLLLGIGGTGVPESVAASLAEDRKAWGAGAGHNPVRVRRVVAGIAPDVLGADRAALLSRMTAGERLVSP